MALPSPLTTAEAGLLSAFGQGLPRVASRYRPTDDVVAHAMAQDEQIVIRASVIRHLLLSKDDIAAGEIRKLDLTGARIDGQVDLSFATTDVPIIFKDCLFDGRLTLTQASVNCVQLTGCVLPAIEASYAAVAGELEVVGSRISGPLVLTGARLSHDLQLRHSLVGSPTARAPDEPGAPGTALALANVDVRGNIDATELEVVGGIDSSAAVVGGNVEMQRATILRDGDDGKAWDCDGSRMTGQINATGLCATGEVSFIDASFVSLVFDNVRLASAGRALPKRALTLDRMDCRGTVYIRNAKVVGVVTGIGIRVGGALNIKGSRLQGDFDLSRATIKWDLKCVKTAMSALIVNKAEIGGDLTVESGRSWSSGPMTAGIGAQAPADRLRLDAGHLHVARTATVSVAGTVNLRDAAVDGDIHLDLARLVGQRDPGGSTAAANLAGARARVLTVRGVPAGDLLDLSGARVGHLDDDPDKRPADSPVKLDGFEYDTIAGAPITYRLDWVRAGIYGTPIAKTSAEPDPANGRPTRRRWSAWARENRGKFKPQPYRQLASVCQEMGNDHDGRETLYQMHRDHNATEPLARWYSKLWGYLQGVFIGYGYRPVLALLWVVLLAAGSAWWFVTYDPGHRLSIVEAGILSLGLVLPGTGFERIEEWRQVDRTGHAIAAGLVLCGILLGATVVAALGRVLKR